MQNPLSKTKKLSVSLMLVLLILTTFTFRKVNAQSASIEINSSSLTNQNIGYYGSGFLLTLLPENAPRNLISDLKPRLFRTQNPWVFQDGSYQMATSNGAEVQYLVYETFFTANAYQRWPGDGGDWSIWENSVRTAVQQVLDKGLKVEYEIWNEPDYPVFWQSDRDRFFETWKRAYLIIKEMAPGASIAGPSLSNFSMDYLSAFLNYAKANNVLPDTIVWHELDRNQKYTQIENKLNEFKTWARNNGSPYKRVVINEIVADYDQYKPGTLVNFLSILERNQILGAHSCWEDAKMRNQSTCWNRTLNGIVSSNYKPRSAWWAYKYYAELSGKLLNLKMNNGNLGGVASASTNSKDVKLLLGVDSNSSPVTINYKSPWNSQNIKLAIDSYKLSDIEGNEVEPEIKSQTINYDPNGTTINLDNLNSYQAMYVKIIEVNEGSGNPVNNKPASSQEECNSNQIFKNEMCIPAACKADISNDGKLDNNDLNNLKGNFGKEISCENDILQDNINVNTNESGEFCSLNLLDLSEFARYYNVENACN